MGYFYPSIPEFWAAVAAGASPSGGHRYAEFGCVEGSCTTEPIPCGERVHPRRSHFVLAAKKHRTFGREEWRWHVTYPLVLRHADGIILVKRDAVVRLRQITESQTGFEACEFEPYVEPMPLQIADCMDASRLLRVASD